MSKCSFCGISIPKGTGKMYVKKDGKIFYFCSNKCEKNMLQLGRKPRNVAWTDEYHKVKEGAKQ
jgi:large subunit ribosomal protein L24e